MANFPMKIKELSKHRLFRYGVPFLVFVLGGSFGLKEFTSLR
jgi:cytochrome c oxidase assembly protein subunit 16